MMNFKEYKSYLMKLNKYQKYNYKTKEINYTDTYNFINNNKNTNINNLSIFFQNINSFRNKIDLLQVLINNIENKFKIIALCETRKINDNMVKMIANDNSFHYTKPKLNKCGGILLIIDKNSDYKITNDYNINIKTVDEIWMEYNTEKNKKTLIAFIYRHPINLHHEIDSFIKQLETSIKKAENKKIYNTIIIVGDVNINLLNNKNKEVEDYINFFNENNMRILSNAITRPNTKNEGSIIDHIYIKNLKNKVKVNVEHGIIQNALSDHYAIYISIINTSKDKITIDNKNKRIINFDNHLFNQNINQINKFLLDVHKKIANNTSNTQNLQNINCYYNRITEIYKSCSTSQIKTRKHNNNQSWINDKIKYLINEKVKLYRKMVKNRNILNETNYKKFKNKLNEIIKNTKAEYYMNKMTKAKYDRKKLWNIYNEITGNNKQKD